jgi:peptidyl-prolyl cis-trans isomerase B (cyclophilin B)
MSAAARTRRHVTTDRVGGLCIVLLAAATILACQRVEIADLQSASALAAGEIRESDSVETPAAFAWPDDPNHPMLHVEIESRSSSGTISIELMPKLAPKTVARVIELATDGYYDGTTFHRVIPGFMIQGGDPNSRDRDPSNDGQGNPNLNVADEFSDAPFLRSVVGMGNKGRKNSTGGQFFIMQADNRNLDGRYTVIGRVRAGMEVVDAIMTVPIDRIGRWGPRDRPIENVVMTKVDIETRTQRADALAESTNHPKTATSALAER